MATFPLIFSHPNWFTTSFIASRLGIDITTVQKWIRSGLLLKRGYVVVLTRDSKGKRYWIHVPPQSRDGMLRKVTIDIPLPTTIRSNGERSIPISGATSLCEGP